MLTDKCKEDFEKWYDSNEANESANSTLLSEFNYLPLSMRYGVYVDFFDSVGIIIQMDYGEERFDDSGEHFFESAINDTNNKNVGRRTGKYWASGVVTHRSEARIKSITQANEIYNVTK
jgi:hypothetical protein